MISGSMKRILLVEDEVIIAADEKMQLEKHGYDVQIVHTGMDAVDIALSYFESIDIILMDIDLGDGIDGTETARLILNHKAYPIVFLSGHTEPEIVEKTEKITSYGYVVKNSGITVLDASIKMAFKLFEAKQRVQEQEQRYESLFEQNSTILLLNRPHKRSNKGRQSLGMQILWLYPGAASFHEYKRNKHTLC